MKHYSLTLLAALSLAATTVNAQTKDQVNLRVINAVQGIPAVSVSIGNSAAFENVAFKQVTPWKSFPEQDSKTLKITLADGRELKTTDEFDFDDDDEQYTILVTPDKDGPNPKVIVLESDREAVDADEVELTLINAATDHKALKLVANDNTLERGVNYGESGDEDIKPGPTTIKVVDSDKDVTVATRPVNLAGGTAVSILVMDGGTVRIINDASPDQDLEAAKAGTAAADTTSTATRPTTLETTDTM